MKNNETSSMTRARDVILSLERLKAEISASEKHIKALKAEMKNTPMDLSLTPEEANELYWESMIQVPVLQKIVGNKKFVMPKRFDGNCIHCGAEAFEYAASRTRLRELRNGAYNRKGVVCASCRKKEKERQEAISAQRFEQFQAARRSNATSRKHATELQSLPYPEYLKTDHWQSLRKRTMGRAGYSCELCAASGVKLHVHHKHYATRGMESLEDLIVLCEPCHQKFHDKLSKG
jgi:5-methylcytosine-specific restriction endonuclease McrA